MPRSPNITRNIKYTDVVAVCLEDDKPVVKRLPLPRTVKTMKEATAKVRQIYEDEHLSIIKVRSFEVKTEKFTMPIIEYILKSNERKSES